MSVHTNCFLKLPKDISECPQLVREILRAEPLTSACLDILDDELISHLEYGFFDTAVPIIKQGEAGKDLFILCDHKVDVRVNDQSILQMLAPISFGDKGIVTPHSLRAATVTAVEGKSCFLIKIPLGKFIRDYRDTSLMDESFVQETLLYHNVFYEIQFRLFKFFHLQQHLWEKVNSNLNALNAQLITEVLENRQQVNWNQKTWDILRSYLLETHQFTWPDDVALNSKNLIDHFENHLTLSFPRSSFPGKDRSYVLQKKILWQKWLQKLCETIVHHIPKDQLPLKFSEIELFNPRIYRMRMQSLLRSIEKRFLFKKAKPKEVKIDPSRLKIKNFFGSQNTPHEFDLQAYLDTFIDLFALKYPNRIMAQIAQQTASTAGKCENEFNDAVSSIQLFLKKMQKLASFNPTSLKKKTDSTDPLDLGLLHAVLKEYQGAGTLSELIRSSSHSNREQLPEFCSKLLESFDIPLQFNIADNLDHLYFHSQDLSKHPLTNEQLQAYYWIPLSTNCSLLRGMEPIKKLTLGSLTGGPMWGMDQFFQEEKDRSWQLGTSSEQYNAGKGPDILLGLSLQLFPWHQNSASEIEQFNQQCQPVLNWLLNKLLEEVADWTHYCTEFFQKWSQVIELVNLEGKIREFESSNQKPTAEQVRIIQSIVYQSVGMNLMPEYETTFRSLAKQAYNGILHQINRDFPDLRVEQRANKAYTLWRYVLSETVTTLYAKDQFLPQLPKPPEGIFQTIMEEIEGLLNEHNLQVDELAFSLTVNHPQLSLGELFSQHEHLPSEIRLKLSLSIQEIIENNLFLLLEDTLAYRERLKQIEAINTEFEIQHLGVAELSKPITRLKNLLHSRVQKM